MDIHAIKPWMGSYPILSHYPEMLAWVSCAEEVPGNDKPQASILNSAMLCTGILAVMRQGTSYEYNITTFNSQPKLDGMGCSQLNTAAILV